MLHLVRFRPQHVALITPQAEQVSDARHLAQAHVSAFAAQHFAVSGFVGGRCVGAAGLFDIAPGRAVVWALLSKEVGPYMVEVSRKVRRVLDAHPAEVIEATAAFPAARRWLEVLGFVRDDTPRHYLPSGLDVVQYARRRT